MKKSGMMSLISSGSGSAAYCATSSDTLSLASITVSLMSLMSVITPQVVIMFLKLSFGSPSVGQSASAATKRSERDVRAWKAVLGSVRQCQALFNIVDLDFWQTFILFIEISFRTH